MSRVLAYLTTLILLAAGYVAGDALWRTWHDPLPPGQPTAASETPDIATTGAAAAAPPRDWPSLFGVVEIAEAQPPAPPPAPEPEPQPPAPPAPPIESLGFSLKGVVSDGNSRWAIVSHPTGDQLLRVGDKLGEHYTVSVIDARGVWAVTGEGAEARLLGFAE